MKTKYIFILLFLFLSGFLFFSNRYDHQKNAQKIAMYNCVKADFSPFPSDFGNAINKEGKILKTYNRYHNGNLDYESLSLAELPNDLFKSYSNCIEQIKLGSNYFTEIPSALRYLNRLKYLDLSSSHLTSLTSAKRFDDKLLELKTLNIHHNEITLLDYLPITNEPLTVHFDKNKINEVDLPRDASEYNISNIDLSSNLLTEFPIELLRIKNISTINLFQNQIATVPNLTESDYQVRHIILEENRLSQFPNQLSKVKNLQSLDLNHNNISGTAYMSGFPDLENLNISQSIDTVILAANAFPKMENLVLANNRISSFQTSKNNIQGIQSLNLINNELRNFPNDILNLKDLKTCYLTDNGMNTFNISNISEHQNLKILTLHNNYLEEIIGIEQLTGLEELDLSSNVFMVFPFEALKCNSLKKLDLSNNQIFIAFDTSNVKVNSLEILNLTGNDFFIFPKDLLELGIIEFLDLSNNKIATDVDIRNTSVLELDLSANDISTVRISGNNRIKKLVLRDNDLRTLFIEENAVQYLEVLDISHNSNFKNFPIEIFEIAPNLKEVRVINGTSFSQKTIGKIMLLCSQHDVKYN